MVWRSCFMPPSSLFDALDRKDHADDVVERRPLNPAQDSDAEPSLSFSDQVLRSDGIFKSASRLEPPFITWNVCPHARRRFLSALGLSESIHSMKFINRKELRQALCLETPEALAALIADLRKRIPLLSAQLIQELEIRDQLDFEHESKLHLAQAMVRSLRVISKHCMIRYSPELHTDVLNSLKTAHPSLFIQSKSLLQVSRLQIAIPFNSSTFWRAGSRVHRALIDLLAAIEADSMDALPLFQFFLKLNGS